MERISRQSVTQQDTETENSVLDELLLSWANKLKVVIFDMHQIKELGESINPTINNPKHNDLYTVCYTSGTTGYPKGVMLSHMSFASNARATDAFYADSGNGSHISYLPLAHCYERLFHFFWMRRGNSIGFYTGNVLNLLEDIQILKPVAFVTVPRLLNRIYDSIKSNTTNVNGIKGHFAKWATNKKTKQLIHKKQFENTVLDKLIFNKIKQTLGGNIKTILTASAPISDDVLNFLRAAFGCNIIQGYGLTETSAAFCLTLDGEYRPGHCGAPLPSYLFGLVQM